MFRFQVSIASPGTPAALSRLPCRMLERATVVFSKNGVVRAAEYCVLFMRQPNSVRLAACKSSPLAWWHEPGGGNVSGSSPLGIRLLFHKLVSGCERPACDGYSFQVFLAAPHCLISVQQFSSTRVLRDVTSALASRLTGPFWLSSLAGCWTLTLCCQESPKIG